MTEPSEIEADIAEFEANRFHSLSPETFVRRLIAALRESEAKLRIAKNFANRFKAERDAMAIASLKGNGQ